MADGTTTLPKKTKSTSKKPTEVPIEESIEAPPEVSTEVPIEASTEAPAKETIKEELTRIKKETPGAFDAAIQLETSPKETQREELQRLQNEARRFYAEDVRRGIDSTMFKMFDLFPNAAVEAFNLAFGKNIPSIFFSEKEGGLEFDKEYYKDGYTKMATELGILKKPEERPFVFGVPEGKHPPQSEEFVMGEFLGENLIFSLLSPYMAKIPYPKKPGTLTASSTGFSLKDADLTKGEKIKRFLSQIGETAIKHPKETMAINMLAGYGAAWGQLFANRINPGSLSTEFLLMFAGGSMATAMPMRTIWNGLKHLKDVGAERYGGAGALNRAKERVQKAVKDPKKALANLNDLEQFHKDIRPLLTSGELSMDEGLLMIQKAFIQDGTDADQFANISRWKQIYDTIIEIAAKPGQPNPEITKKTIEDSIQALKSLIDDRLNIARARLAQKMVEKGLDKISSKEANLLAREIIDREYEIARQTDKELWDLVNQSVKVPTSPIRLALKNFLEQTRRETGDITKLTSESSALGDPNAISRFIGEMVEETTHDVVLGTTRKVRKFSYGAWGDEVDLGSIQALRHRLLLEAKDIRSKPAPNKYKLSLLAKLDEAFLQAVGALERTGFHGPLTAEAATYERALAFTRHFKTQYGQPTIKKLMEVDKSGNPKVIAEVTLEKIFLGKGAGGAAKGEKVIDEFLSAVRTIETQGQKVDPEMARKAVDEMRGAIEHVIKARFTQQCVEGGVISKIKGKKFITDHQYLWEKEGLVQIKRDLEEAIQWNEMTILKESKFDSLRTRMSDPKSSFATIYLKKSPDLAFNDLISSKHPNNKSIEKELKKALQLLKRDETGQAREGFESSFMLWIVKQGLKENPAKVNGEFISGMVTKALWENPKVQYIASRILDKDRYKTLAQIVKSTEALELAKNTHIARGGTFDTLPNPFIERMLRWAVLKYSPMPDTGRGSIAAQQLVSAGIRDTIRKHHKTPALEILNKAFMERDIELMKQLFEDILP